ncbi:hypothetical protein CSUI_003014 [Cystoisospora suis]|uniref:Transmembrane protein n=1 Tax=Cystoisospora suis TaxID=483139 RepID=A0A2C6L775_9APIC|nr:hypothetical protein CSUI_003014 [Cystoisospora suis]
MQSCGLSKLDRVRSKLPPRTVQRFSLRLLACFVVNNVLLYRLGLLQVVITMTVLRLDCRVTFVSLFLVCLSASGFWLRVESAEKSGNLPGDHSTGQVPAVPVCSSENVKLSGASKTFKFKCLAGWKLSPVEDTPGEKSPPTEAALKKVNVFGAAGQENPVTRRQRPLVNSFLDQLFRLPRKVQPVCPTASSPAIPCTRLLSVMRWMRRSTSATSAKLPRRAGSTGRPIRHPSRPVPYM